VIDLGGKRLCSSISAPWVHWPDTMFTYLAEPSGSSLPAIFWARIWPTSDLYATDEATVYRAAKRYYAEIMMPFRQLIKKHLERISKLQVDIIAPSHGPAYNRPEFHIEQLPGLGL